MEGGEGAPCGVDQRVCCHGREERGGRGAARQECCGMHGQRPPPEPVARGARLPAVAVGLLGPWQRCGQQLLMGRHPALPVVIVRCVGHEASDVHTRAVTARSGRSVSRPDLHERAVAPSSEPLHLQHLSPQGDHYAGTVRLARHGHHARHARHTTHARRRRGRDNYTGVEGHGSQGQEVGRTNDTGQRKTNTGVEGLGSQGAEGWELFN